MDGGTAAGLAIDGGVSDALSQALRAVADADLGAGPKYPAPVIRDLERTIAARAHGRPALELMHLVRVAEAAGGRHGWPAVLLAVPVARAAAFRGVIQGAAASSRAFGSDFALVEDGVEIGYPDGRFRITYARMAFLSALVDFATTALGWQAVDGVLRGWLGDRFAQRAAGPHANALSRLLYDYLKEHLPSVQALRGYRRLTRFLSATRGPGFGIDDLDDAAVLAYWSGAGGRVPDPDSPDLEGPEAGEVRTFRAAVEQVARLRGAMQAGFERRAFETAAPIGGDRAAGEVDPDRILGVLEIHDAAADPLRRLADPPASAIKFLTGRETEALDLIAALGPHGPALPLSVLRAETFGVAQARLTQAIRRRAGEPDVTALVRLDDCESYDVRIARWDKLDRQLARIALAALAVLIEAQRAEAALEIQAHAPDVDLGRLARGAETVGGGRVMTVAGRSVGQLVSALRDPALAGPAAAAVVAAAEAALRAVSRQGFGAGERSAPGSVEGFVEGAPAVRAVRGMLDRVRRAVDRVLPSEGRSAWFDRDRAAFSDRFGQLYGAGS